jgi:hypothetical protein
MLAKETDEEDARKIDVMNEIIKLVKGYWLWNKLNIC